MYAPMRPSTYRGPTHIGMVEEYDDDKYLPGEFYGDDYFLVSTPGAQVLTCDAWGRLPGATGRDRSGRDLPPPQRGEEGDLSAVPRSGASPLRPTSPATSLGTGLLLCLRCGPQSHGVKIN